MTSPSLLPPLYAAWVDGLLAGPLPAETKATCSQCAMCAQEGRTPAPDEQFFSPVTKCCTYLPQLANFLVGRVLSDDDPEAAEGRRSVEARIAQRVEVTPLGLGRSRVYALKYQNGQGAFGMAESMACPHHLADGRCGVWRHRESTCATWFCKHDRGATGQRFWHRLHDLLAYVESVLSRHAVLELGLSPASLEAMFPPRAVRATQTGLSHEQLDERVSRRSYEAAWGTWLGREHDFYRQASSVIAAMRWDDVLKVGGTELALHAQLTREAYARVTSPAAPTHARRKQLQVLYTSANAARVGTYSYFDPLVLPKKLLDVMHCFDGRPTEDALRAIEAEHRLRVGPAVVQKLVDFGVLEDV